MATSIGAILLPRERALQQDPGRAWPRLLDRRADPRGVCFAFEPDGHAGEQIEMIRTGGLGLEQQGDSVYLESDHAFRFGSLRDMRRPSKRLLIPTPITEVDGDSLFDPERGEELGDLILDGGAASIVVIATGNRLAAPLRLELWGTARRPTSP